jgi:carboxypeptidase C (cathepsin A)
MFYQRFPEFKPNKFWIAGESYCGMYIPFFANEIITQDPSINLQGILIGNGAMWLNFNWRRMIGDRFWMSHYYYGPEISQLINRCKYTDDDDRIPSCARGMYFADRVIFCLFKAVEYVNPYLTTGVCYTPDSSDIKEGNGNRKRFYRVPFHTNNNPKLEDI